MRTRRVLFGFVLASMAVAAACAGKTSTRADDASPGSDASASDAAIGARPTDCPATEPKQGDPCKKAELLCEYGDDYNPLCNKTVVCSSSGAWASPIFYGGSRSSCGKPPPAVPPNPATCAPNADAIPAGEACTTKDLTCAYDKAICTCGVYCSSYPVRMPDCNPDAGVTTSCCDTTKVAWNCFTGPAYCGTPRPRIGSPCTKEGDECAIDPPVECGQTVMQCHDGVWNLANTTCPISTARAKREISYVDATEAERLRRELLDVRLATYRYKSGDPSSHLGFIIEDMPDGSPAVLASRDRVDLYGYVSMTVATVQQQQREIDALKATVERLVAEKAALERKESGPARRR